MAPTVQGEMAKQDQVYQEVKVNNDNSKKLIEDISRLVATTILNEEDEAIRQRRLSGEIDTLDLRADEDKEEAITDEQEDDPFADDADPSDEPEETEEEKPEETEEDKDVDQEEKPSVEKEEPEDFKVPPPDNIPAKITITQVEKQINNLRAGKSLKDKAISDELEGYFDELGEGEKQALFVYLASLASILTGGSSGDLAPSPESLDVDIEPESQPAPGSTGEEVAAIDIDGKSPAPIIVGESANVYNELMFIFEQHGDDNHRCLDGRMVPFGSSDCINDLDTRIDDTSFQRDSLSRASADRASLNGTLKFLRQKKRKAEKIRQQDQSLKLQSKINLSDEL